MRIIGFARRKTGCFNLFQPIMKPLDAPHSRSSLDLQKDAGDESHATEERPSQLAKCLRCDQTVDDGLHLGPDGPSTLCFPCHRRYSCRELPLYRHSNGSITVFRLSAGHRVDHVGFQLEGMQRDLAQPIVKPWLGKARESATVLATKKVQSRPAERLTHLEKVPFKFQRVDFHRTRVSGVAAARRMASARKGNSVLGGYTRVKEEENAGSQSQHESRTGRDFLRVNHTARAPDSAQVRIGETTGGLRLDTLVAFPEGNQLISGPARDGICMQTGSSGGGYLVRSGIAVKATCCTGGNAVVRRFAFHPNRQPEAFIGHVRQIFGLRSDFFMRYKDGADDEITVSTVEEITELFVVALESCISPVLIEVIPLHEDSQSHFASRGLVKLAEEFLEVKEKAS